MIDALMLLGFGALAVASDWLSCVWHRAREQRKVYLGALVAALMESLTWLPLWFAIEWNDFRILIVSVLGSAVGSIWGFRGQTQKKR